MHSSVTKIANAVDRNQQLQKILDQYQATFDSNTGVLTSRCDTGFFSNCSFTLACLIQLSHLQIYPKQLCLSQAFGNYKDEDLSRDVYKDYFEIDPLEIESIRCTWSPYADLCCADHHTVYSVLPFPKINPFVNAYFRPSAAIRALVKQLVSKYDIDLRQTVALVYRGTDKSTEVAIAEPERYVTALRGLRTSRHRVLVQTDQQQAKDYFLSKIPNSFSLDEMPTTQSSTVLHKFTPDVLGMSKHNFGMTVLATTILLSRCHGVVNHCGNMALWIALYRGNAHGMTQFDRHGLQVGSKQVLQARAKNALRQMRRWWRDELSYYA